MANKYENRLPDPVSPSGLAASAAGQGLIMLGDQFIKVTDRNTELQAEEIKRAALAEVDRLKTGFDQGMALESMDLEQAKLAETKRATGVAEGLAERTLAETKRGNVADERLATVQETRLQAESEARIREMENDAALRERALDDAMIRHNDSMTNEEKRIALSESDLRLRQSIADKNWDLAEKELKFQKEKFGWTKKIDELKIEQADKSLNETVRQFDVNQDIRQQELQILDARLDLDTLSQKERQDLAEKKLKIEQDLAALQDKRYLLDEAKQKSDESYRQATLGIAQEELKLKQQEGKWHLTTQDKYGEYCSETHPDGTCKEYKTGVIGEEIVAINLKEPELKDIRIMQEDGAWLYGTPDGLKSEFVGAVKRLNTLLTKKNPTTGTEYTLQEAIGKAKELSPDVDWDDVGNAFIFKNVSAEVVIPDTINTTIVPDVQTPSSVSETNLDGILSTGTRTGGRNNAGTRSGLIGDNTSLVEDAKNLSANPVMRGQ